MSDPRLSRLAAAFRDTPLSLGGRTMRRPTAGTIAMLMDVGNPLFTAPEVGDELAEVGDELPELSDADAQRGVFEFIYLHTAPIEELAELPIDPAELKLAVARRARALGLELDFEDLQAFAGQFGALRERLEAAMTEDAAPPARLPGKPGETVPTGLPAWSTPSAVPETKSGSDTSSGSSHSSAPCNTSTPPTSTTGTPADGPSPVAPAEMDPMPIAHS